LVVSSTERMSQVIVAQNKKARRNWLTGVQAKTTFSDSELWFQSTFWERRSITRL